ncbi:hypothetical protein M5K25_013641 [Dendrobium thyrsiflorum]|uniref:Uncharacterized protein n=1 Tax=Dendrobium thyrsiflorum TaxID=117978 RepID=A0ABD0V0C3_DENTH
MTNHHEKVNKKLISTMARRFQSCDEGLLKNALMGPMFDACCGAGMSFGARMSFGADEHYIKYVGSRFHILYTSDHVYRCVLMSVRSRFCKVTTSYVYRAALAHSGTKVSNISMLLCTNPAVYPTRYSVYRISVPLCTEAWYLCVPLLGTDFVSICIVPNHLILQGYFQKITFCCRTSTFRKICDHLARICGNIEAIIHGSASIEASLLSECSPGALVVVKVGSLEGRKLQFTIDEVVMILGLPNKGTKFELGSARISGKSANDIKHEILSLDDSTPVSDIVKNFIIFLLILSVALHVDQFLTYNWPAALRDFLVVEFDAIARTFSKGTPLGYMNGFIFIVIVSASNTLEPLCIIGFILIG